MKFHKNTIISLIPFIWCAQLSAAPVEFDTPSAHIIVARPVDAWSGDASASKSNLKALKAKRLTYYFTDSEGQTHQGSPAPFSGISNHPITKGVEAKLTELGVDFAWSENSNTLRVLKPIAIPTEDIPAFLKSQQNFYKRMVVAQSNPATLEARVSQGKVLGSLLSIATLALSVDTFGASAGSQAVVSSGITDSVYRAGYQYNAAAAPVELLDFDFSQYKQVDVRKISTQFPDRVGQIIIAYKNEKTASIENEAMIQAIVALSGIGVPIEEIEKSRADDLASRVQVWKSWCETNPEAKCKAE